MSEFTNGTVAQRRISRVVETLFGGDESLIPVLDYSKLTSEQAHYFAFTSVFPPAVMENEGRRRLRWWDTTAYVLAKDPV